MNKRKKNPLNPQKTNKKLFKPIKKFSEDINHLVHATTKPSNLNVTTLYTGQLNYQNSSERDPSQIVLCQIPLFLNVSHIQLSPQLISVTFLAKS